MNVFQILILILAVGGILFLLVGMELKRIETKVDQTINCLRQTLKELARIYPLD